jgi:hypothetical protein
MTAEPIDAPRSILEETLDDAHWQAHTALFVTDSPMEAVVWLSAHVAAVVKTIEPAAARLADEAVIARHHDALHRLQHVLRVAERLHSGDALASGLDPARLRDALAHALRQHEQAESALIQAIERVLPEDQASQLVASYCDALEHAPTRPHPHAPHHGVLGAIAFRVDALRDRVMDTMDSRHVPLPRRPHEPAARGRWGSYLLGQMHADEGDTAR